MKNALAGTGTAGCGFCAHLPQRLLHDTITHQRLNVSVTTGCFALTCHHCGCGFCAICLNDCGKDAHNHCREVGGLACVTVPNETMIRALIIKT